MQDPISTALKPVLNTLKTGVKGKGKGAPSSSSKQKRSTPVQRSKNSPVSISQKPTPIETKLETLSQFGESGVLQATTQVYNAEPQAVLEAIDAVITRLAMTTSIFCFPGGVHPSYVGMYLQMAFLTYIKMCGELTGSVAGLVPTNLNDWAIPLPFAKFLQGYGKYYEDGVSFRSSFNHTTAIQITGNTWGPVDGSTTIFSGSRNFYPTGNVIYSMLPFVITGTETAGFQTAEWFPRSFLFGSPIVESDFSLQVLRIVSEAISTSGMSYVIGNDIPHIAPCASAYTNVSGPLSNLVCYFLGVADNFHSEVAIQYTRYSPILAPSPTNATTFPRAYSKRCICMGMDEAGNGAPPWYLQTLYNTIFILSTYHKYPKKTLMDLRWCKVRLTTLYPVPVKMHYNGIADLVNYHYQTVIGQWNYSISSTYPDLSGQYWFAYHVVTAMTFLIHLYRSVPYHRNMINFPNVTDSVISCLQSQYASPGWLTTKLPPLISNAISDVGIVVYRGRMYYPDFYQYANPTPTSLAQITSGPLWGFFANLPLTTAGNNANSDFLQPNLVVTQQSDQLNAAIAFGYELAAAFYDQLYTTPEMYPLFTINGFADLITEAFYSFHDTLSTNLALNDMMIHIHNDKCGSAAVLLTSMCGTPYVTSNVDGTTVAYAPLLPISLWPLITTGTPYPKLLTPQRALAQVGSLVQLNPDDLLRAIVYFLTWDYDNFGTSTNNGIVEADAKFGLRIQPSVSTIKLLHDLIRETFSPNAAFGKALAQRQAEYRPIVAKGLINIVKRPEDDHCFIGKLFDAAVGAIGNSLRLGVGQVSGVLCGVGASMLGVPELSPLAKTGCSLAATKVYDMVGSLVGVDANDVESSNRTASVSKRAVNVAVNQLHQSALGQQRKKKYKKKMSKRKNPAKRVVQRQ